MTKTRIQQAVSCLSQGYQPGDYKIIVRKKSDGSEVSSTNFSVTTEWADTQSGPGLAFTGKINGYSMGATWGGGPTGIQNYNIIPPVTPRRICVLMADTSDQRYPADVPTLNALKTNYLDQLTGGVVGADGVIRSSDIFYREVSYNQFNLTAQLFGPYNLPNGIATYLNADNSMAPEFFQAVVSLADGDVNFNDFDTIIVILQALGAAGDANYRSAWPYAYQDTFVTADGTLTKQCLQMPNDWVAQGGGRDFMHTYNHELGHNLGFGDQYPFDLSQPAFRDTAEFETMSYELEIPHFSLYHRLATGWTQDTWVRLFNFQASGGTTDEIINLTPIERGAPGAGQFAGIQVRLTDGWNYYFEYRAPQSGQIGDQAMPSGANGQVVGYDVVAGGVYVSPITRRGILLLRRDDESDGEVLDVTNENYHEQDVSTPTFPANFEVKLLSITGGVAQVRVRYGINEKPDPSIRPWPASPTRQWQSPDIEIKNDKNAVDPAWKNVPWLGKPNTIVATIHNNSLVPAPQVNIKFFVKDYNVGGVPMTQVGSAQVDVPANGQIEAVCDSTWTPPTNGHYCIVVQISEYQTPGVSPVSEAFHINNEAQSNYDQFYTGTSSPAHRVISSISVGNPYSERTIVYVQGGQDNPLYRTYLEHKWVRLDPGETKAVRVMYEYDAHGSLNYPLGAESLIDQNGNQIDVSAAHDQPNIATVNRRGLGEVLKVFANKPNNVKITGYAEFPHDDPRHTVVAIGGVDTRIIVGRQTKFRGIEVSQKGLNTRVITKDTSEGVRGGTLLLSFYKKGENASQTRTIKGTVDQDGNGFVEAPDLYLRGGSLDGLEIYYLPTEGYTDCMQNLNTLTKPE